MAAGTSSDRQVIQPGPAFAMTFILCVISLGALMAHIPESYLIGWRDFTVLLTKGVGLLLGLSMTSEADILTVNGFAMRIILQCTAIDYLAIMACAMLLYSRHPLSYRLLGLAVAAPVIVLANVCRLIVSGLVGSVSRSAFDLIHDYLWVIAFALIVFAIWTLWVNGRFRLSRAAATRIALVAVVSALSYGLLLACQDGYGSFIAQASSFIYALLHDTPAAAMVWDGKGLLCQSGGVSIHVNDLLEEVNIAIYLGLMLPLQKRGDWELLGMTLLGLLVIVAMSATFLALGAHSALTAGTASQLGILRLGSFVNLALPMTIYWIMTSGERERKEKPAPGPLAAPAAVGGSSKGMKKKH